MNLFENNITPTVLAVSNITLQCTTELNLSSKPQPLDHIYFRYCNNAHDNIFSFKSIFSLIHTNDNTIDKSIVFLTCAWHI